MGVMLRCIVPSTWYAASGSQSCLQPYCACLLFYMTQFAHVTQLNYTLLTTSFDINQDFSILNCRFLILKFINF